MNNQVDFDTWLAAKFEEERRRIPHDALVAATMRKVRAARRRKEAMRVGLRVAALVAVIGGSPWLIEGASQVSAAMESFHDWTLGLPGTWILGILAIIAVVAMRVRSR
jgi:hypothetical protein